MWCNKGMKEAWTGQVHLLTPPAKSGNTRCWVNVVALAENTDEYAEIVRTTLALRSWSVLEIRRCIRASECPKPIREHKLQIEQVSKGLEQCICGTLHYYPSRVA